MTRQGSQAARVNVEPWNIDAFSARLKEAMDGKTAYALEKETGIAQSLIRKYLSAQSAPGADKLVVLSRALGVSASWLLTGESSGLEGGGVEDVGGQYQQAAAPAADMDKLEEVAVKVLALLDQKRPDLSAKARGRIVRLVYEFYIRQEKPMDEASLNNVIELAAFR